MNNLFNIVDNIDLTSVLAENEAIDKLSETNEKFCKSCFNPFITEGDVCNHCKRLQEELTDQDREVFEIAKEVEDQLPILGLTDITELDYSEQKELITDVLDMMYGENLWNPDLVALTAKELGLNVEKVSASSDDEVLEADETQDIKSIQDRILALKAGLDGLDKTKDVSDETKFEVDGKEYTKSSTNSEISSLSSKLDKINKSDNKERDNAFGEEKLAEALVTDYEDKDYIAQAVENNPLFGDVQNIDFKEGMVIEVTNLSGKSYYKITRNDSSEWEAQWVSKSGEALGDSFVLCKVNKTNGEESTSTEINESVAATVTVDNIDQEPKDKATIEKAIEIAGDKDTIDNDTFRDLRLKLANKDYDMVDKLDKYALVRGEDVIYTWLRAEDTKDNLDESEKLSEGEYIDPAPEVKIKDFYAGTENGEEDYQFDKINPNLTFQELYDNIDKYSITSLIGDVDSAVRNTILNGMCDAFDINDAYTVFDKISDDLPPYEGQVNESVHVNVSGGNVDVSTDDTNISVNGDDVDVHVDENPVTTPTIEPEVLPIDSEFNAEEILDEPATEEPAMVEPIDTEEVLNTPEDNLADEMLDDSEDLEEGTMFGTNSNMSEQEIADLFNSLDGKTGSEWENALYDIYFDDDLFDLIDEIKTEPTSIETMKFYVKDSLGKKTFRHSNISMENLAKYLDVELKLETNENEDLTEDSKVPVTNIGEELKNNESVEGTKKELFDKYPELKSDSRYTSYADDDYMAIDFNEDGSIKGIRLTNGIKEGENENKTFIWNIITTSDPQPKNIQNIIALTNMTYDDVYTALKGLEVDGKISFNDNDELFTILDLHEEALQVSDVPSKVDHKRIELAKMESEDKVSYRVSYLKEDDEEIAGWDIDADTDEDAIATLDKFNNADEIADDLLTAQFVETGIDGVSSLNYKNTEILLSNDEESNIITINQDDADPIILKGDTFDSVINQLIYWFIMNIEEEVPAEMDLNTSEPEEISSEEDKDIDLDSEDDKKEEGEE